jgi:hypothetical protein
MLFRFAACLDWFFYETLLLKFYRTKYFKAGREPNNKSLVWSWSISCFTLENFSDKNSISYFYIIILNILYILNSSNIRSMPWKSSKDIHG